MQSINTIIDQYENMNTGQIFYEEYIIGPIPTFYLFF